MLDADPQTRLPRLLSGHPGTSTEGRTFIVTQKGDERAAVRLREAGGQLLREKGEALIWGFSPETATSEIEALCENLREAEASGPDDPHGASAEGWDFDIGAAPRGREKVITGKVAGVHDPSGALTKRNGSSRPGPAGWSRSPTGSRTRSGGACSPRRSRRWPGDPM